MRGRVGPYCHRTCRDRVAQERRVKAALRLLGPWRAFTVNPSGIGVAGPTIQANYADFSYVALVNQTATNGTGTFYEQGAGFFSSYRFPTLADVVPNAGINTNYKLYPSLRSVSSFAPMSIRSSPW
jgi:hypothetical protein